VAMKKEYMAVVWWMAFSGFADISECTKAVIVEFCHLIAFGVEEPHVLNLLMFILVLAEASLFPPFALFSRISSFPSQFKMVTR
jgi:hypothetical protein